MVLYFLLSVWVKICRKEIKDNIGIKVVFDKFIPQLMIKVSWCRESHIVHRCETTVSDKEQNPNVKKWLPLAVSTDNKVFSEAFLFTSGLQNLDLLLTFSCHNWRLLSVAVVTHLVSLVIFILTNLSFFVREFKGTPLPEKKSYFLFSPDTSWVSDILDYYFWNYIVFCRWLLLLVWHIL